MSQSKTAILLFAEDAKVESLRKPLIKGSKKRSIQLFSKLNKRVKKLSEQVKTPFIHFKTQTGADFGEKLHLQIAQVFDSGYERVIVLGNDIPTLNQEILKDAICALESKDIVLGPSTDGGVYLIGINKKAYSEEFFRSISWCTSKVQADFEAKTVELGIELLWTVELADIDNSYALKRWAKECCEKLQHVVSDWLKQSENRPTLLYIFLKPQIKYSASGYRGPPVMSF